MNPDLLFWKSMSQILNTSSLVIDRPKGSSHPRFPTDMYPFDYGYLENTSSSDGGGIDVWVGSLNTVINKDKMKTLTGILCTFDTLKRDAEIKLLMECSTEDIQVIREFHKDMHTLYIPNPVAEHALSH